MNTAFHKVDIDTWERRDEFAFFINSGCGFTLTSDIDISKLYAYAHEKSIKLYPLLVATVIQVINAHREFRYGWGETDTFGYYDVMHPMLFDKTSADNVKQIAVEYKDDIKEQVNEIEAVRLKYKSVDTYNPQGPLPKNIVQISCVPWIKTTGISFCLQYCATYLTPILVFGKYEKRDGKVIIPLTVYCNHAVNDGFHCARLFMEYQELVNKDI